jgi:hypothetical protein
VSEPSGWRLDPDRLDEALALWIRHAAPDASTRAKVREFLLWLELEPLTRGAEDPDHPGVWFGRVADTNVGVTYVPVSATRMVYVTLIR